MGRQGKFLRKFLRMECYQCLRVASPRQMSLVRGICEFFKSPHWDVTLPSNQVWPMHAQLDLQFETMSIPV